MPIAKKTATRRTRKPKVEGVDLINTAEDIIREPSPEEGRVKPPREQKTGPRKVLGETQKAIADTAAAALSKASGGADGRGLLYTEAQSITTPVVRLVARRIPNWTKKFVPKVKMNPDDAADVEEIAVTLGKYALRLFMLLIKELVENKEATAAARQQARTNGQAPAPVQQRQQAPAPVQQLRVLRQEIDEDMQAFDASRVGVGGGEQLAAFEGIGADYGQEGA